MSQTFWGRYATMDEFIKALCLRMKEIGYPQDILPSTVGAINVGSGSLPINDIFVNRYAEINHAIISKSFRLTNIVTKTTTYTAVYTDSVILVTTAAAWTLTLPAAATVTGQILVIKKTDAAANALTIDGNAAETIDGAATNAEIDAQYDCLILLCDGTGWHIIGRKIT